MISVTILTKNSEKYLPEVLDALRDFEEVVVYDTGSQDSTLEIAKQFPNVTIYEEPFLGFGETHNRASASARHDWILSIDSDEVASAEMVRQIKSMQLNDASVYTFPRRNFFNGKWIRWCGWYPDRVKRLYHRKKTKFSDALVHESIIAQGMTEIALEAPLLHYSYDSISDFIDKMQSYSSLFAEQNKGKKPSSLSKAILHGMWTFVKSYLLKRGFLGGYEGFVISLYNGHTAYYKYLKLYEANQNGARTSRMP